VTSFEDFPHLAVTECIHPVFINEIGWVKGNGDNSKWLAARSPGLEDQELKVFDNSPDAIQWVGS